MAATTSAKRILEIGHFLGRSTSAICEDIRGAQLNLTHTLDQVVLSNKETTSESAEMHSQHK